MDLRATLQQALMFHQQRKLGEAERLYRLVLQHEPLNTAALHNLGLIARDAGHFKPALELIAQSIALEPGNLQFRANQVTVLDQAGQRGKAEEAASRLVVERPDDLKLRVNFAFLLAKYRKFKEASEQWERLLPRMPQDPGAHFHAGFTLEQGGNPALAERRYESALALKPDLGEAFAQLGGIALRRGDLDRAVDQYQRAVSLLPDNANVVSDHATALSLRDRVTEALTHAERAYQLAPSNPVIASGYANILLTCGNVAEAASLYARAAELASDPLEYYSDLLMARLYLDATGEEEFEHHQRFGQLCVKRVQSRSRISRKVESTERLRIGYVSPDFRTHPVGLFIEPLLANHDRNRFEIHCFSTTTTRDDLTDRVRALVNEFHDIDSKTITLDRLETLVRGKEIDILIDLAGHTGGNLLELFARKPAPLQISYLGYPNTTGLGAIEFRITDAVADPPGTTEAFHSETLLRMPDSFALFQPPRGAPPVRPSPCLSNGFITFGTLARIEKWSAATLRNWARILNAVPEARFRAIGSGYEDSSFREQILSRLMAVGIEPARVDLVGHKPMAVYLEEVSRIDLLLDTNPFNNHTTTLQALYMGVPTVTLAGTLHRSRMGASVMTALDLSGFIARAEEEYRSMAVEWAGAPDRLADLRGTLRDRLMASSLADAPRFTRAFERLLCDAWKQTTAARSGKESAPPKD